MKVKVLGCSGGIGGALRTTGFLIDHDILIDAGTGVGDLSIEQLIRIDHIFVTHSHLDHIASIPLLVDTVFGMRQAPVIIHATAETWDIIKTHIFNWKVWPDFSVIPDEFNPFVLWEEISVGQTINLDGRKITPIPANHVVPAVGFHLQGNEGSLIFTGDTTSCDGLWEYANQLSDLKYLVIETAFSNAEFELARLSKHLCPSLLVEGLAKLKGHNDMDVFITHLKPGEGDLIMHEIERDVVNYNARALVNEQLFDL